DGGDVEQIVRSGRKHCDSFFLGDEGSFAETRLRLLAYALGLKTKEDIESTEQLWVNFEEDGPGCQFVARIKARKDRRGQARCGVDGLNVFNLDDEEVAGGPKDFDAIRSIGREPPTPKKSDPKKSAARLAPPKRPEKPAGKPARQRGPRDEGV